MEQQLSDIEQVLEFLRKNGLSDSESALMDDILEKSHLASFDFQRFLFPLVPPTIPSVKIPAARLPPSPPRQMMEEVEGSSDDEFVSLGSSTTDLYSSGDSSFCRLFELFSNIRVCFSRNEDQLFMC